MVNHMAKKPLTQGFSTKNNNFVNYVKLLCQQHYVYRVYLGCKCASPLPCCSDMWSEFKFAATTSCFYTLNHGILTSGNIADNK